MRSVRRLTTKYKSGLVRFEREKSTVIFQPSSYFRTVGRVGTPETGVSVTQLKIGLEQMFEEEASVNWTTAAVGLLLDRRDLQIRMRRKMIGEDIWRVLTRVRRPEVN
jgi:hypothetical protein